jgi:hypothetical protein
VVDSSRPRLLAGLVLISASALTFEVTLVRLFAIQQFYSFAFLVVSLAVMGFSASGTILAIRPAVRSFVRLALAYSGSLAVAYLVLNFLPFDSFAVAVDARQLLILGLTLLSATGPFLFAGWVTGASLAAAGPAAYRPYAANLAGSALGVPLALAALALVRAEGVVWIALGLGLGAAAAFSSRLVTRWGLGLTAVLFTLAGARVPTPLRLNLSPYKPLSLAELAPEARRVLTRSSPLGRLDVVERAGTHHYPGLSLNAALDLPQQTALFVDGDGPFPATDIELDSPRLTALAGYMPSALVYELRPGARALILTPGAGLEALIALGSGAPEVELAADQPLILEALAGQFADVSGQLLMDPRVSLIPRPGRAGLLTTGSSYGVIDYALADPFRPVTNGAFSLTEEYSLTVEGLTAALDRLAPDGLLILTRWTGTPPSEVARAWATLLAALRREGEGEPGGRLLAYRGMRTVSMIASRRPFLESELAATRAFLERNAFDPVWLPDLRPEELNRHNRLPTDTYHELFRQLLTDSDRTLAESDFNLRPPTDDRPYFFHYFRWRQTPEVVASLGLIWQPFGGSGYLVLVALLVLVTALAALLLLLARWSARGAGLSFAGLVYFAGLGAGYLLVEIPLIQRFALLLDRPSASLAVVLTGLLAASGLGSLLSRRWPLRPSLALLTVLLGATLLGLPSLVQIGLPWSGAARVVLALGLLLPLGVLMGIPFAAGLRRIAPASIPLAWAVNGAASGIGGILAAMIALDLGQRAALAAGALAYLSAWGAARRL